MKELSFKDFYKPFDRFPRRLPLYGQIELTYKCNCDCIHCYCRNLPKNELPLSFWEKTLDQIRAADGLQITFTGGDPLCYRDFPKVYLYAKKMGFMVKVYSNGLNFNREILDLFENLPPLNVEITINSLKPKNYEKITRLKGAFPKLIQAIEQLKKRKIPLAIKCNGLKENKTEIFEIKKFTEKLLGKHKFKFDSFILPGLDGSKHPLRHRLDPKDIIALEKKDPDMLKQRKQEAKIDAPFLNPKGLYHCSSWIDAYFINPQGRLLFCRLSKKYSTDLKKTPFKTGFEKFLNIRKAAYTKKNRCIDCEFREYCLHCPARAHLERGNEESPVEYYCRLAKLNKNFLEGLKLQKGANCEKTKPACTRNPY